MIKRIIGIVGLVILLGILLFILTVVMFVTPMEIMLPIIMIVTCTSYALLILRIGNK